MESSANIRLWESQDNLLRANRSECPVQRLPEYDRERSWTVILCHAMHGLALSAPGRRWSAAGDK